MFGLALSVQNPTFTKKKNVLSWVELYEQLPIVFFKSLNAIESLNEARTIKENGIHTVFFHSPTQTKQPIHF